jgi:anaerobic ribonucleoside-triphosphate reductase
MKKIPCEIYTRVVGYYRPTTQFNKGKQSEYKDRNILKIKEKEKEE